MPETKWTKFPQVVQPATMLPYEIINVSGHVLVLLLLGPYT
jgi:hypothetical protein